MSDTELKALTGLRISLAPTRDDVWRRSEFHVDTLHRQVAEAVLDAIGDARDSPDASPVGVVVQGQRGSGKTHLLGWVREQVQRQDGYFFLVSLLDGTRFWHSVAHSMLNGLTRRVEGHETQLRVFLRHVTLLTGVQFGARQAVIGDAPLDRGAVDAFLEALHRYDPEVALACRHTARALVMFNAGDFRAREVGNNFLLSGDECEPGERAPWGLPRGIHRPEQVVSEVSWLLALTGPSVIAVDQIDGLLAPLAKAMASRHDAEWQDSLLLDQIANGLMSLREATRKTLTVVAAQHATWEVIKRDAIAAVQDRFVATQNLGRVPSAEVGQALVAKRLKPHYRAMAFTPPYPTWPIQEDAFDDAVNFMPRQLLQSVDRHIRACVSDGAVREMTTLQMPTDDDDGPPVVRPPDADLAALDERLAELKAAADIGRALAQDTEDIELPGLLSAGLQAWIAERGDAGKHFEQDPPPSTKPALHARLRRTLNDETEEEAHWGFRGISAEYHANAVLNRIRTACTEAGLASDVAHRRLFLLRNRDWPQSPKNREAVAAFEAAGGRRLTVTDDDLRTLWALRDLLAKAPADLQAWLIARQPTRNVAFLRDALADAAADLPAPHLAMPERAADPQPAGGKKLAPPSRNIGPAFDLGVTFDAGTPVPVNLEALRKHTAIFAGSGSGKTVLIRRMIEECALQGVSAIVLDPNNDLARLGDPWPEPPAGWCDGDAEKAQEYLENTDVVVYTHAGRPGGRSASSHSPTSTASSTTRTSSRPPSTQPWRPSRHGRRWTARRARRNAVVRSSRRLSSATPAGIGKPRSALAPSGAMTACTRSTLALASQARKYGLGLVFATQSPKGLHNHIPGNAATQCYGLLNAPVQIDAAREMARAKGGDIPGISQLRTGEFYVALEGQPFAKVRTPLCLSHHPKSPLTTEEVLDRSRAS